MGGAAAAAHGAAAAVEQHQADLGKEGEHSEGEGGIS